MSVIDPVDISDSLSLVSESNAGPRHARPGAGCRAFSAASFSTRRRNLGFIGGTEREKEQEREHVSPPRLYFFLYALKYKPPRARRWGSEGEGFRHPLYSSSTRTISPSFTAPASDISTAKTLRPSHKHRSSRQRPWPLPTNADRPPRRISPPLNLKSGW